MTLIVYPFRPVPGDLEDVTEIMMDFDAITAVVNGNIDETNIKPGSISQVSLAPGAMTLTVPTGAILPFGGDVAPTGFLLCDGTSYPVATYAALHAVVGYKFGGSGGNFNVPPLKGKFLAGHDAAQAEFNGVGLGAAAAKGHKSLQAHGHSASSGGSGDLQHSHGMSHDHPIQLRQMTSDGGNIPAASLAGGITDHGGGGAGSPVKMFNGNTAGIDHTLDHGHTITVSPTGAGDGQNLPPYVVCNYIIKT